MLMNDRKDCRGRGLTLFKVLFQNVPGGTNKTVKIPCENNRFLDLDLKKGPLSLSLSLSMTLQPFGPWPLFSFLNLCTVGRIPWTGDQPVARPLPTHRINTQTSMPLLGFQPAIPVFERAKMVHALDRTVTVIGKKGPAQWKQK
jgi:hypothetical protein